MLRLGDSEIEIGGIYKQREGLLFERQARLIEFKYGPRWCTNYRITCIQPTQIQVQGWIEAVSNVHGPGRAHEAILGVLGPPVMHELHNNMQTVCTNNTGKSG